MPTIKEHAIAIGERTLDQRPFDALDGLILTQIVYMPMEGLISDGGEVTLAELWDFLQGKHPDGFTDPFQHARYGLTEVCAMQPRYRDWRIHSYENRIDLALEMQFAVCSFGLPDSQTFIAFRGTDTSIVGWKEDLNMSFMTVPSQLEAVKYTERIAKGAPGGLILGGHSKGGNLSVFAGIRVADETRERIEKVYNFDGPGMDEETLKSAGYGALRDRIDSYLPHNALVGTLLHYHPVYTVVKSSAIWVLQHDAMSWQVADGAFVTLPAIALYGKLTDETVHLWLGGLDLDSRKLFADTLYQILMAAKSETLEDLIHNFGENAVRILMALWELEPGTRRSIRGILRGLLGASAAGTAGLVRSLLSKAFSQRAAQKDRKLLEPGKDG